MNESDLDGFIRADRKILWHPFTPMGAYGEEDPLIIEKGEGAWLIDIRGKRYLDGVASLWVNLHGHRHPAIDKAIKDQLDRIAHSTLLGLTHPPAAELARELVRLTPEGLEHVFYSDNGSTAVEVALKLAYHYWQLKGEKERTGFITLDNAYHGDTLGAVSVGGIDLFHAAYHPLLFEVEKAHSPYCYRCPLKLEPESCDLACLERLEKILGTKADRTAALIIEPLIQAAGGMIAAPINFLARVRELTRRHGVLMIADEVAVGFGRTGTMFACEQEEVSPDIMCLAKGITAGYLPLAATMVTAEVFESFSGRDGNEAVFYHGHSYTGNPLGCAAALANLKLFRRESVLDRVGARAKTLWDGLERFREHPHVGEVRGRGLMVGIELVADKATKEPYPAEARIGHQVTLAARERGLVTRPLGNVLIIVPPYNISESEIGFLLEVLYAAADEVTSARGS